MNQNSFIKVSIDGTVAVITIHRPPVNAFNNQLKFELANTLAEIELRSDICCAVLRAEGDGFTAGNDLAELHSTDSTAARESANAVTEAIFSFKIPLIAAVHGYVAGLGVAFLSGSDIIVAAENTKVMVPEIHAGTLASPFFLQSLIPERIANYYLFIGEPIPVSVLDQYGATLQVVPKEGLDDAALAIAHRIAKSYPRSLRLYKEIIAEGKNMKQDIVTRSKMARLRASALEGDPNREEILRARAEKRPPIFRMNETEL